MSATLKDEITHKPLLDNSSS